MRSSSFAILVYCFVCLYAAVGYAGQGPKPVLETFNYKGVKLDDGRLEQQYELVKREYLSISNDDLLIGFRKRAGLSAPGKELGGWYTADSFHIFGQILSGLSRFYAGTGDKAFLAKVDYLIAEWAKCIDDDGYFYYTEKPNAPHYTYEKTVGGLVDAYVYCGNKQAAECLSRITDWAVKNLNRENVYGRNSGIENEWYTLSENLYRAYLATGNEKYMDFARVWEYTEYWDIFAQGGSIFDRWHDYHAYSHVNAVSGAGAAYQATGQEHYLKTLVNAHDYLNTHQCWVTGGYGPRERFKRNRAELIDSLYIDERHFETQCGSWATFKLCKYLLIGTGDARFGDWIERMLYNGIGASLPCGTDGSVHYWSNYNVFGAHKKTTSPWSCCAGTRPEAVADYCDLIWFKDAECIYANLYVPSTVTWKLAGQTVTLSQQGVLEELQGMNFTVKLSKKTDFGVGFRVPGWLKQPISATVNGKRVDLKQDQKHWAVIKRRWNNGDSIRLSLPMKIDTHSIVPEKFYPVALSYGPVTLAVDCEKNVRLQNVKWEESGSEIIQLSKSPLVFGSKSNRDVVLKPYYAFAAEQPYRLYIDPKAGTVERPQLSGSWRKGGGGEFMYSNEPNAIAKAAFEGTSIRWEGRKYDDGGKAEISIDGQVVDVVDQYDPEREKPFEWQREGLTPGPHVISVRVLGEKNENSKNAYVNVEGFKPVLKKPSK